MIDHTRMVFQLLLEAFREGKIFDIFRDQIWNKRVAIPAEMDLSSLPPWKDPLQERGYQFIELLPESIQNNDWSFHLPSRRSKAVRNLNRGYRGFALIKDSIVVGDIWCITSKGEEKPVTFRDLNMLGIECKAWETYAFDMLIIPDARGKNLAVPFQRCLYYTLKSEGYQKLYGYYWEDNIPAMWMHRMLKFKEHPKRKISRFFSYLKSSLATPTDASNK